MTEFKPPRSRILREIYEYILGPKASGRARWFAWGFILALIAGVFVRILIAFTQAVYVDEAANFPATLLMAHAVEGLQFSSASFGIDKNNPEFTKIFFGVWGTASQAISPFATSSQIALSGNAVRALTVERLVAVGVSTLTTMYLYQRMREHAPLVASVGMAVFFLLPQSVFLTSLVLIPALLVPFTALFTYFIAASRVEPSRTLYVAALFLGLCVSTQFLAVPYIVYPVGVMLLAWSSRRLAFGRESLVRVGRVYFYLIAISVMVFVALNPYYWTHAFSKLDSLVAVSSVPAGLPSGVVGLPVFFDGSVGLLTPSYSPLLMIVYEVPVAVLALMTLGVFRYVRYTFKRGSTFEFYLTSTALVSFLTTAVTTCLIQHLHAQGAVVWFSFPVAIFAGYGAVETVSLVERGLARYRRTHSPAQLSSLAPTSAYSIHPAEGLGRYFSARALTGCLVAYVIVVCILLAPAGATYTNELAVLSPHTGAGFTGAWGSPQEDRSVAEFMCSHGVTNVSVLVLAQTSDISDYCPQNEYTQYWHPVNVSVLESTYLGWYVVVDQWYAQLFGNPLRQPLEEVHMIFSASSSGGYSELAHIGNGTPPVVNAMTSVSAESNQTISITGAGFGTSPGVMSTFDSPYVNTVAHTARPWIDITDFRPSVGAVWSAGVYPDAVGIRLLSWNSTQITLGGFTPNLWGGPEVPGAYTIHVGDQIRFSVYGSNASGARHVQAIAISPPSGTFPEIQSFGPIRAQSNQSVSIVGSGFGSSPILVKTGTLGDFSDTEFNASSPALNIIDLTNHGPHSWSAGFGMAGVGIGITTWRPSAINLSGFSLSLGLDFNASGTFNISVGDSIEIVVYGPNLSGAAYVLTSVLPPSAGVPSITGVSRVIAQANQTINISGVGFGTRPLVNNTTVSGFVDTQFSPVHPSLAVEDLTNHGANSWSAGFGKAAVGISIISWTSQEIHLGGFSPLLVSGSTTKGTYLIAPGDLLLLVVYGPNSSGASYFEVSVAQTAAASVEGLGKPVEMPAAINQSSNVDLNRTCNLCVPAAGSNGVLRHPQSGWTWFASLTEMEADRRR